MTLYDPGAVVVAIFLSHAGWGTLSMTMARHVHETWGNSAAATATAAGGGRGREGEGEGARPGVRHPPAIRKMWTLRSVAMLVLLLSILPLVTMWGAPIGIVAWCGVLTLSCLLLALQLHYASHTLRFTVSMAALGAVSIALLALTFSPTISLTYR